MKITAGTAGGRVVGLPLGVDVRPTSDKVKQALFNRLGADFHGKKVLDLFCGSGNLGLEALSRDAQRVVFADRHARCTANAGDHAMAFGFDLGRWNAVAAEWIPTVKRLAMLEEDFDFILLDPPYQRDFEEALLANEILASLARPGCKLSLEHASETAPPIETPWWTRERQDNYGDTTLSLYAGKKRA